MNKTEVIAALKSESDAIRALGASTLYVFGSTVSGRRTAESDIDVFVDYTDRDRFSLIELVGINQLLERRLGLPVDVTTRDSLDPLLRRRIEATAERVF
jgi:predicted nucleotidyltransferase